MLNNKQQTIVTVEGYYIDEPNHIYTVNVSLGYWNGIEDHTDNDIFYYMDDVPLNVGDTLSDSFIVTAIEG